MSGFILGLGLLAPAAHAQMLTPVEAQAALTHAEQQLAELQARAAAQQEVTEEQAGLGAALEKLEAVLREIDARIAEDSLPSERRMVVNRELGGIRATLAAIDGTIRPTGIPETLQTAPSMAQALPAPVQISATPAETNPVNEDAAISSPVRTMANIRSSAQNFARSWQNWAIVVLVGIVAARIVINRRRSSESNPLPVSAGDSPAPLPLPPQS